MPLMHLQELAETLVCHHSAQCNLSFVIVMRHDSSQVEILPQSQGLRLTIKYWECSSQVQPLCCAQPL